jgi:hypothetical protein
VFNIKSDCYQDFLFNNNYAYEKKDGQAHSSDKGVSRSDLCRQTEQPGEHTCGPGCPGVRTGSIPVDARGPAPRGPGRTRRAAPGVNSGGGGGATLAPRVSTRGFWCREISLKSGSECAIYLAVCLRLAYKPRPRITTLTLPIWMQFGSALLLS